MQFDRTPSRTTRLTTNRRDSVHGRKHHLAIRDICSGQARGKRQAVLIYHLMPFGTRSTPVHRRRAGYPRFVGGLADRLANRSPFFAPLDRTLIESTLARLQSIWCALSNRANRIWCKRSQTPAPCQSRNRRQQVMPLPQPISRGSISQGMPLLSTNRIPVKAARSSTGGRPRLPGPDRWTGNSGAMIARRASSTNVFAISREYPDRHFC